MNITSIKDNSGTLTLYFNEKSYVVPTHHLNYDRINKAMETKDFEGFEELFNVAGVIAKSFGDGLEVDGTGQMFHNGEEMHNAITRRIVQFFQQGKDFAPLVLFMKNLMLNPSHNSVEQLLPFLDNVEMPITDDGCFVGYKAISNDWKDKYTGKIDNSLGKVVTMPRNEVDDNPKSTCSKGLHIANHNYASGFGGGSDRLIAVKVNPMDCVCVPDEYGAEKLRACKYIVLAEIEHKFPENEPIFFLDQEGDDEDLSFLDDEEDDVEVFSVNPW
jgi:hypothetical protein